MDLFVDPTIGFKLLYGFVYELINRGQCFNAERAAPSHEGLANHMEAESRTAFPPPRDYVRRLRNAT